MNYLYVMEKIERLEEEFNLFEKKIQGVYYWKLIRVQVIYNIMNDKKEQVSKDSFLNKIKKTLSIVKNSVLKSPHFKNTKPIWFLENPRKVLKNTTYIDPYTHYLIKEIGPQNMTVIEARYKGEISKSVYKSEITFDSVSFSYHLKRLFKRNAIVLTKEEAEHLLKVESEVNILFNLNIKIFEMVRKSIHKFIIYEQKYHSIFKKKKLNEIYIVCSYGKEALISAAKKNQVVVNEIQHGFIGRIHPGYSFKTPRKVRYLPDVFLTFGDYWTEDLDLPMKVKPIGYLYLEDIYKEVQSKGSKQNLVSNVLFISQQQINLKIAETAYEFAKENPSIKVFYKLHPTEFSTWKIENKTLKAFSKLENTKVYSNEVGLHELIYNAEFIVGVNSTALFESVYFEKPIGVLKLAGYESMFKILYMLDKKPMIKDGIRSQYKERDTQKEKIKEVKKKLWCSK